MVTSTPGHRIEHHPSSRQTTADNESHVATNQLIELMNSTIDNEAQFSVGIDEPIDVLPARAASNDAIPKEGAIVQRKLNAQKQLKRLQGENSQKNNDRLNRKHFFLKNVETSKTHVEVFISIVKKLHMAESNTTQNTSKLDYLCVASNVLLIYELYK